MHSHFVKSAKVLEIAHIPQLTRAEVAFFNRWSQQTKDTPVQVAQVGNSPFYGS